jgi:MinD-like ATPase involved in chromosome partitioning or flagellar assembly
MTGTPPAPPVDTTPRPLPVARPEAAATPPLLDTTPRPLPVPPQSGTASRPAPVPPHIDTTPRPLPVPPHIDTTPKPLPVPAQQRTDSMPSPADRVPQGAAQPPMPPAPPAPGSAPVVRPRPGIAFPAPEPVLTVDPRLTQATGKPQHGDSVARRSGQSLRRIARPSAQAGGEEARWARELRHPVTKGRVVAVTSIRGGVGKTTTAALVARTLQRVRQDPVLALEADAALGTLAVRLGAQSVRWSCGELARILKPSMHLLDITGYLVPLPDGGWLLPASQGRVGPPLDVPTYRTVTLALRRHFAMTVVDCETLPGDVARTAMDTAHARIIVAPMTPEGVGGTRVVLDWLAGLPHSTLPSTVVALTSGAPDQNLDLTAATAHLRETGVGVVHLPYDRHLAAGGQIHTDLLASATRSAAAHLAAEAVQRAVRAQ